LGGKGKAGGEAVGLSLLRRHLAARSGAFSYPGCGLSTAQAIHDMKERAGSASTAARAARAGLRRDPVAGGEDGRQVGDRQRPVWPGRHHADLLRLPVAQPARPSRSRRRASGRGAASGHGAAPCLWSACDGARCISWGPGGCALRVLSAAPGLRCVACRWGGSGSPAHQATHVRMRALACQGAGGDAAPGVGSRWC
jgi:hypothetical protein